ncbi:MAG TPA: L-histidine N(alpha)-methyltransferase [Balneolaceae bacterium]|nr:L-histidine N(alpha)-methyltransferase [Balneolaceae bacterium]
MSESTRRAPRSMAEEVLSGLQKPQKTLSSKFFYDKRGSKLFEKITRLPEYYPTRTERKILRDHIDEIARTIGPSSVIIEPGSGSSKKTRLLLDHVPDVVAYIPVDISQEYLGKVVQRLRKAYPSLIIKPVCADYTRSFQLPEIDQPFDYYVIFYPGSTIGNFHPDEAREFLRMLSQFMVPGGGLLIGVDLKKDKAILEAAYNDRKGITAAFNKNMLKRLNRELNADFVVDQFAHRAFYNEEKGRIEMHLVSRTEQDVHIQGETFHFSEGETIHTENSYKYSLDDFKALVSDCFSVNKVWTDKDDLFSLQYLVKKENID